VFRTWAARYTVYGVLLGLLFPGVLTLTTLAQRDLPLTLQSILAIHFGPAGSFAHLLTDTLPVILGALLGLTGRERDRRERDVRRLHMIADIRGVVSRATGLDTLLNALAPRWAELIDARECSYAAWSDQRNAPAPLHPRSPYTEPIASRPDSPAGTPLAKWVIEHNAVKILDPIETTPAVLAVPLALNNRAFGAAFFVNSRPMQRFSQADAEAVLAVTDQIALTIGHIRSSAEIRRRARDMEAIGQVGRRIAAGWDIERILTAIAESTQVRFGVDHVGILTVDEAAGEFVMRAQAGPLARPDMANHRQKVTDGLAARVYTSGQMVLTSDVRQVPDFVSVTGPDARSELILPLRSSESVIGIIGFASRYVDAFGEEDISALQMLADQVAVAVENARLYEDAQRERQRLSAVLASTGDTVIVTDADDRVQLFNRAAEQLFGVTAEQAIGQRVDDMLRLPGLIEAYRSSPEAHVFELALSDTTTLLGNLTLVRAEHLGLLGRVLTLHDISDLKRLDQLKSQMIRMASHDLRSPLNLAFGYLDLLEDTLPDRQDARRYIEGLGQGLRRMRTLIQDLLDIERIESEAEQIRQPIDLNEMAQRAAAELLPPAAEKRQQLSVELEELPAYISADPVQIYQVLINLMGNAIKYTPTEGQIQARVRHDAGVIIFEVSDNGLGIPKAAQAKLFQRFYRVKMPGTEDIEGTGLGLSLVKAVVEQHRGTVEVHSEEGQGSTFCVRLPALDPAQVVE